MKRRGWILISLLTLLLTAFVLAQAGRLSARCSHCTPRNVELRSHAQAVDPFMTDAAFRWRNCEPHHWRACLLQQ